MTIATMTLRIHKKVNIALFSLLMLSICSLASVHPFPFFSQYDEKRIIEIVILSLISLIAIFSKSFQTAISQFISNLSIYNQFALLSFFGIGILSSLLSIFPLFAFAEVSLFFLLFLLALFVAQFIHDYSISNKLIISTFIGAAILYSVAFFAALAGGISEGFIDLQDLAPGFFNRRFLNQFQSISLPLLLVAPLLFKTSKLQYFGLSLLAAFWIMLVFTTNGRGVVFASLLGIIISGTLLGKARKKWWFHTLFIILLGLLLFALLSWFISDYKVIGGDITRLTSSGRLQIWINTLFLSKEALFLGHGPLHFAFISRDFSHVAHPHNITLQLIYEWGVPATLLVIGLVLTGFWKWIIYCRKHNNSLLTIALTSSFIAAIIHGQLSGVFVMPLSQLSFVIICGWMIGIYYSNKVLLKTIISKNKQEWTPYNSIIIIFSFLALAGLLFGSYPHLKQITGKADTSNLYLKGKYRAESSPRFWSGTLIYNKN